MLYQYNPASGLFEATEKTRCGRVVWQLTDQFLINNSTESIHQTDWDQVVCVSIEPAHRLNAALFSISKTDPYAAKKRALLRVLQNNQ